MSTTVRGVPRTAGPRPAASWWVHHAVMLVAMIPCLVSAHEPMLHVGGAVLIYLLCMATARRCRRDGQHLPALVDELAMLALLVAGFLAGHAGEATLASSHHGGQGSVQLAHLIAAATAFAWLTARGLLWRDLAMGPRFGQVSFAVNATMVAWMLVATLAG